MTRRTALIFTDVLRPITLELLTLGATLGRVDLVTTSAPTGEDLITYGRYGVEHIHQIALPTSLPPEAWRLAPVLGAALAEACRRVDAEVLLVPATCGFAEAAAVCAATMRAGLVTDATALAWDEGRPLTITKRVLGGTWTSTITVDTDPAVVTVRANSVTARPAARSTVPEARALHVEVASPAITVERVETVARAGSRPELSEAAIVVAGGRGTGGNFGPLEELADELGAAVGATRDAAFEGWWDSYIGQTGTVISPRLYLAAGISGAPHHAAGIRASQVIVSVNNDPDAPMVQLSDLAVIGDVAEVLPAATAALRAARLAAGA
ncbi:MAG: electron transfer flavoprotein subunit alpha/FixB family protein [Promicromonosporaceae bacterium]|nr:electron transfer flavoprotein subunit alpha/FixB family protein [Promicromonosporaceae bacterium]